MAWQTGRSSSSRWRGIRRSEEHTSELQSRENLVCRLLLEKKKKFQVHAFVSRITDTPAINLPFVKGLANSASNCGWTVSPVMFFVFFFNDTATTEIYTLSLHDALPI